MAYFAWDSSLDTGIESIDGQHRQIVTYINELHTAIVYNNKDVIPAVLDKVVRYTLTHFSFEEELIERARYQHHEAHREVHKSFARRMQEYRSRLISGEDVGKQLLSDLRIWLTNHIKKEDRDYIKVVQAHLQGDGASGWLAKSLGRWFSW